MSAFGPSSMYAQNQGRYGIPSGGNRMIGGQKYSQVAAQQRGDSMGPSMGQRPVPYNKPGENYTPYDPGTMKSGGGTGFASPYSEMMRNFNQYQSGGPMGPSRGALSGLFQKQMARRGDFMRADDSPQGPLMTQITQRYGRGGGGMRYPGGSQNFNEAGFGNRDQALQQIRSLYGMQGMQMGNPAEQQPIGPSQQDPRQMHGQAGKEARYQAILQARREGRDPYA